MSRRTAQLFRARGLAPGDGIAICVENHPWLLPLYVVGAFLTMLGTLYGTLEIACAIFDEMTRAVDPRFAERVADIRLDQAQDAAVRRLVEITTDNQRHFGGHLLQLSDDGAQLSAALPAVRGMVGPAARRPQVNAHDRRRHARAPVLDLQRDPRRRDPGGDPRDRRSERRLLRLP